MAIKSCQVSLTDQIEMHKNLLKLAFAATLSGFFSSTDASPPGDLELKSVVTGLNRPVVARHAGDGLGRLFVVEQPGQILIIDNNDLLLGTAFLDISDRVEDGGMEQGLLGLAFDPSFAGTDYFYVNYTYNVSGSSAWTRVSRFSVSEDDMNKADKDSEYVIIEINQDFSNHNGGDIHFGPDGYLYIGMGDGGSGGDPRNRAQTLSDSGSEALLGKMLRIDVHGSDPEPAGVEKCGEVQNYKIPFTTDNGQHANPWLGDDGVCDEIWTYGWRNPWRWSFDRSTGDMFVGDVGQRTMEEISWQSADHAGGDNYGWNCKEGSGNYPDSCEPQPSMVDPILEYTHVSTGGRAVTGGYVYRGNIATMQGDYIYSDYCNGYIWFAGETDGSWSESLWLDTGYHPSSFGEDEAGELYLVHIGTLDRGTPVPDTGAIYRFVSPSEGEIFVDGFETP